MFVYKTEAELKAMSEAERDQYATEKRQHEANEAKKTAEEAGKNAAKKEVEDATKGLNDTIDAQKQEIEDLKETVKSQGEKIVEQGKQSSEMKKDTIEEVFQKAYDEVVSKNGDDARVNEPISIDTSKAIVSTDVMSVNTVNSTDFPTAGSTGVVSSTLQTLWGKLIGFFGYRAPSSKILEVIDVQPMDSATLVAINETVVGDAEVTTECKLKPIVKMSFSEQTVSAEAVSTQWFTTTKLRRFFPALVNRFVQKFTELINDKIPSVVLEAVKTGASAFTPDAALAINTNPNNYDAIGAVIAVLENLGYVPNAIMLNPIAWRNMKQEKTSTGIYTLSNGQSISILQNALDWGGVAIPIIKDPKLGVDEFVVGDMMECVKAGVDTQLMYFETDGRTDAQSTTAVTGVSRNIRTHVLEKFFAVVVPTAKQSGVIKDTFANVKTLITSA